jgi:uncharacterized membrane protein YbhN (UPF0104 family)
VLWAAPRSASVVVVVGGGGGGVASSLVVLLSRTDDAAVAAAHGARSLEMIAAAFVWRPRAVWLRSCGRLATQIARHLSGQRRTR